MKKGNSLILLSSDSEKEEASTKKPELNRFVEGFHDDEDDDDDFEKPKKKQKTCNSVNSSPKCVIPSSPQVSKEKSKSHPIKNNHQSSKTKLFTADEFADVVIGRKQKRKEVDLVQLKEDLLEKEKRLYDPKLVEQNDGWKTFGRHENEPPMKQVSNIDFGFTEVKTFSNF